jgi:DUF971 family protein
MGQPGQRADGDPLSEAEIELVQIQPVGRYAVQFAWGDGHSTGIYTYELLRSLH